MKETHNEFMEKVVEESREPTLREKTYDALNNKSEAEDE